MSFLEAGDIAAVRKAHEDWSKPAEPWEMPQTILSAESSLRLAVAHMRLSCPELVSYRSGWFLTENFDPENADLWFAKPNMDVAAVEAMLNHIHLQYYTFGGDLPEMTVADAMNLGHVLAYQWKNWARDIYNLNINVYLGGSDEDGSDVQIWFESQGLRS
jgi:hypothetical protein